MRKDLSLPVDFPEGFVFTDPSGLTSAQAEEALQEQVGYQIPFM